MQKFYASPRDKFPHPKADFLDDVYFRIKE